MRRSLSALLICFLLSACANSPAPTPTATLPPTTAPTADQATSPATTTEATTADAAPDATTAAPQATTTDAAPEPDQADSTDSVAAEPTFESADCEIEIPEGQQAECGYLTVPESRTDPDGRTVRLHVAVFKSKNPNPQPDPIVYLEGGPGGHTTFVDGFKPFLEDRDFIMFDQRGVGTSEPALNCQETIDLAYELLDDNISLAESNARFEEAVIQCRDRLAQTGVNLSSYDSAASAADLNDLREALGYESWNLYGISYGTRLALTAMRDHPEGIRSVILDSTVPLQTNETDLPANADRAFQKLFDGCAANERCNAAFPNLEQTFFDLVERLNREPVTEEVTDPLDGQQYTILLNGDSLISAMFLSLYISEVIPLLPQIINDIDTGRDYSLFALLAYNNVLVQKLVSTGMYYSVRCAEEVPFSTRDELLAADDPFPEQRGIFDLESMSDICSAWGAIPSDAVENQPVQSDLPTLVLGGEYDPVTPPADGELAAQTLSKSTFLEFPGLGHGVTLANECPANIAIAFLNDPTAAPDSSCINAMSAPEFVVR
jgi:pimeloyl-ACP methyl ester carboxylesterase